MKSLVFDIETDGLQPTKIYCMSVLDVDSQEQFNFKPNNITEGISLLESADKLIGHNIIGFDIPVIRRLHNIDLLDKKLVDTLVLSRLFKFSGTVNQSQSLSLLSHSYTRFGYNSYVFTQLSKNKYNSYSDYYNCCFSWLLYIIFRAQSLVIS